MLIKNIGHCFMRGWGNGPMSKIQNAFPQRHSIMSNLKIETENTSPQRHSIMSILNFGCIAPAERSEQAMFSARIKNVACCFGRLSGLLCRSPGGGPYCPSCLLVFKTAPARRDSGIYKLAGQAVEYLIFKAILLLLFSAMNKRWRKNGATDIINRISREYV